MPDRDNAMDDQSLQDAQRVARAILKAWGTIHEGYDTKMMARLTEAVIDVIALEWERWISAVREAGEAYIETSADFVGEVMVDPDNAGANVSQSTWDSANTTFDQIFIKRWSGPVLANVLNTIQHVREEARQELVQQAKEYAEGSRKASLKPQKPKRRKMHRKKPTRVTSTQEGD